jgi:hypothetical protein
MGIVAVFEVKSIGVLAKEREMKCSICKKRIVKLRYTDSDGVNLCSDDCIETFYQRKAKRKAKRR